MLPLSQQRRAQSIDRSVPQDIVPARRLRRWHVAPRIGRQQRNDDNDDDRDDDDDKEDEAPPAQSWCSVHPPSKRLDRVSLVPRLHAMSAEELFRIRKQTALELYVREWHVRERSGEAFDVDPRATAAELLRRSSASIAQRLASSAFLTMSGMGTLSNISPSDDSSVLSRSSSSSVSVRFVFVSGCRIGDWKEGSMRATQPPNKSSARSRGNRKLSMSQDGSGLRRSPVRTSVDAHSVVRRKIASAQARFLATHHP